jgi:glucosamine kinase
MTSGMIFCVDGGGTNTRARLYSPHGAVLAEAQGGPCNISTDPAVSASNVVSVWLSCAAAAGCDPDLPDAVRAVIGAAGTLPAATRRTFLEALPNFGALELVMDGHAALIGAGLGQPCLLLIAGTGAVGHGLYADGRSIRRDGWGWIGGDRGGGAWIGRKAIRHAIDVSDGLCPPTPLGLAVLAEFEPKGGIASALAGIRPHEIAAYSRLVFEAARQGDTTAEALIERAVGHFSNLILLLEIEPNLPVFMAGGMSAELAPRLARRLSREIRQPETDALHGCYLIATGAGQVHDIALSIRADWGRK